MAAKINAPGNRKENKWNKMSTDVKVQKNLPTTAEPHAGAMPPENQKKIKVIKTSREHTA